MLAFIQQGCTFDLNLKVRQVHQSLSYRIRNLRLLISSCTLGDNLVAWSDERKSGTGYKRAYRRNLAATVMFSVIVNETGSDTITSGVVLWKKTCYKWCQLKREL